MNGKLVSLNGADVIIAWEGLNLIVSKPSVATAQVSAITCKAANTFKGGSYFIISDPLQDYYVYFTVDGNGFDPKPENMSINGFLVELLSTDTAPQVATKLAALFVNNGLFTVVANSSAVTFTNNYKGLCSNPIDNGTGFTFVNTPGVNKEVYSNNPFIDVLEILDVVVIADGSAKILVKSSIARTFPPYVKQGLRTHFDYTIRTLPAGTIAV